ncbi:MAG: hypothetical protein RL068_594 [Actinomycetota bacterium]|jgi:hypothetical protein
MENPIGLGGITLVVAAIVWLAIFVPGFTKRSEIRANTSLVRKDVRQAAASLPLSPDDQLRRLINTQRSFSVLFAIFLLGAIATAVAAVAEGAWWLGFSVLAGFAVFSLAVSRAAGSRAAALATTRHRNRQQVREQASSRNSRPQSRDWMPNPIPAPLNQPKVGEIANNLADVIEIQRPENPLAAKDLDAILARRRAI